MPTLISLLISLFLLVSVPVQAEHMYAVARMQAGYPDIDTVATPYHGHVLTGQVGQFGLYLFSGTPAQLAALDALPNVIGLCLLSTTESGGMTVSRWAEVDNNFGAGARTRLNTWLTNNGKPTIPAGWTNKQVIRKLFEHLDSAGVADLDKYFVKEHD
jgi:hypothetical protein